jgi:hypothetical protein
MVLSNHVVKAMGFSEIPVGTRIEALFNLVLVYNVEGINFKDMPPESFANIIHRNEEFSFAFGNSINEIFKTILNDNFVENEGEWQKEKNTNPPYLVVHIGLKDPFVCETGYWKKEKENILTYDAFPIAKQLLKECERRVIPALISSLTLQFSKIHNPIRFKKIERVVFGKTITDENLFDIHSSMSAKGFTSRNVSPDEVKLKIRDSMNYYYNVDPKVSSLFHSGLEENDRFKQFLNFFQALEIYTHKVFKKIEFNLYVNKLNNVPFRIKEAGTNFLLDRQSESKNLNDRFMWCAILVWDNLEDKDIEDFKSIKKIRDELSHGEQITESNLPNEKIEKLLLKIL